MNIRFGEYWAMLETFAALAEPNRLRIVELLQAGAQPVGVISERLRLRQPQVSKHLAVLKDAGLVEVRPLAQQRLYELLPGPFHDFQAWLEPYRRLWSERFEGVDAVIEELNQQENRERARHVRKKT
jgi:DNA-binding transcriptional ArsR family regulator